MDDLEALRQKRLRELQAQQAKAAASAQDPDAAALADAQAAAQEQAALERVLQQILDSEARERLTRIRLSRPELADAVTRQLVALAQQGRLTRRLTDADLRAILAQVPSDGRDIKITRK
jgi:programmed cell death protein 5